MKPRYVPWETVERGDKITAEYLIDDVVHRSTARIGEVVYDGRKRHFMSEAGAKVFTGNLNKIRDVKVLMLEKFVRYESVTLF